MDLALEARGLEKRYAAGFRAARRAAVGGVDLALGAGRTLGLVGPNGSGKSTLLRMLAGVERPSAGELRILGRSPQDPRARAKVGYLSEGNPFPGELRARETLELVLCLSGLARGEARARARRGLERVGLAAEAEKPLARFSLGMHRRFGLAQAFLHEPELVLLDEPTAGLDAPGHGVLEELVGEARARGAALVLASHHPSDLLGLADEIAVLVGGRVAFAGTPLELVRAERRARIDVAGLAPPELDRLEEEIVRLGGRVLRRGPPDDAFLELYRRLGAEAPRGAR